MLAGAVMRRWLAARHQGMTPGKAICAAAGISRQILPELALIPDPPADTVPRAPQVKDLT
jgi:hypothetical protein